MANLEPKIEIIKRLKVQPTDGEWKLLNFLVENLDDNYEIFYQPFLNGDSPDFAILKKGSGLVFIEVKDWNLASYTINEDMTWRLKKDNAKIKSPFKQVLKYKENLFQLHSEELFSSNLRNRKCWATVNCVVYFHCATQLELNNFLNINLSSNDKENYDNHIKYLGILANDSLDEVELNKIFSKFWLNKQSYFFSDFIYKSIRRYLKPPFHQLEEGKEIIYTKQQLELIKSEVKPYRKIKGIPGSGKTIVLAKRAVNSHIRTGNRVLILTYNLTLKNYIHDRLSDVREDFYWSNFYITNYHEFFKTQSNNYNLPLNSIDNFQDLNFFEKFKSSIIKYDTILIDEIQDYRQSWIDIVTKYFMHDNTEFIVFGDEKQNIYERELDKNNEPIVRKIPGSWNRTLNTSHRFSTNIGNIAVKFQKVFFNLKYKLDEINYLSKLDFEERIIEYHAFNSYSVKEVFISIFSVLIRNEIHPSDVGILSSKVEILRELDFLIRNEKNERTATTFESKEEFEKFKGQKSIIDRLRRNKKNHFWMKTGTLKLSTIHSFKGWEIDTLFLIIEKDANIDSFSNSELIYTALTRARRNLIVINLGDKKYDDFFRLEIQNSFSH